MSAIKRGFQLPVYGPLEPILPLHNLPLSACQVQFKKDFFFLVPKKNIEMELFHHKINMNSKKTITINK